MTCIDDLLFTTKHKWTITANILPLALNFIMQIICVLVKSDSHDIAHKLLKVAKTANSPITQ